MSNVEDKKRKRILKSHVRGAVNAGLKQSQLAHKGCIEEKYFGSVEKRVVGAVITALLYNKEKIEQELPVELGMTVGDVSEINRELESELAELVDDGVMYEH